MATFKWTFAADDKGAVKMMKDFAAATKQAESATDQAAGKMSTDLDKVASSAQKATASQKSLAEASLGGLRQSASQGIDSLVGQHSTAAGNVLSQFGGSEALFGGISAGAVAAGAGIAVAGAAVVKFGVDSVKAFSAAAEAVDNFQDKSGATAEQSSVFVGAAQQLGVSTDSMSNALFNMLKNVDANEKALKSYGATVVRAKDGSVDSVATFESVARAYANIKDPADRAELATKAFGKTGKDIIDLLERGGPELDSFFQSAAQHAPIFSDQDLRNAVELKQKMTEIGQEWDKLKVKVGEKLIPWLETELVGLERLANDIGQAQQKMSDFRTNLTQEKSGDSFWEQEAKGLNKFLALFAGGGEAGKRSIKDYGDAADEAGKKLNSVDFSAKLHELHPFNAALTDAVPTVNELGHAANNAASGLGVMGTAVLSTADNVSAASAAFKTATADIRSAMDSQNNYAASVDQLDQLNQKMATSSTAVADAQVSGAKQVADAQKGVEDALNSVADAQANYAKAVDDANRSIARAEQDYSKAVDDANRKVTDAEEQASKRIVDAQQKVTDARHRAAEAAESSARRVEDATQALRDAETDSLRDTNPYDAQRKREEAGKNLTRAQEDAAQQQADSADTVAQAEKDLADTQRDSAKDRADAERDAAEQIAQAQQRVGDAHRQAAEQIQAAGKQVEDAEGRVAEASARVQQTSDDAQAAIQKAGEQAVQSVPSHQQLAGALQGVTDNAFNAAYQMKLAGASDEEIRGFLATTKQTVNDYATAWGFSADEVKRYNDQVALIDSQIDVNYVLHLNANQFLQEMQRAGRSIQDPYTRSLFDQGIIETVGAGQAVPHFTRDSGGPLPPGLSLVSNLTGRNEWVSTPEELANMSGGGITIIVQGSVISDRELADIVAKAQRRGYKGFN